DVSSMSRFIRMVFGKVNSVCDENEESAVGQFFHLLSSVSMNRGICKVPSGEWDITVYSSCANTDRGLYYYTTYDNRRINCVDMYKTDLKSNKISRFPLEKKQDIKRVN
ncbi:MAG: linear amide C-N hydrolase, partial [Clostridia bacterium]|nr:linear amide C-N hydrolase [Clostridia bacterium]